MFHLLLISIIMTQSIVIVTSFTNTVPTTCALAVSANKTATGQQSSVWDARYRFQRDRQTRHRQPDRLPPFNRSHVLGNPKAEHLVDDGSAVTIIRRRHTYKPPHHTSGFIHKNECQEQFPQENQLQWKAFFICLFGFF